MQHRRLKAFPLNDRTAGEWNDQHTPEDEEWPSNKEHDDGVGHVYARPMVYDPIDTQPWSVKCWRMLATVELMLLWLGAIVLLFVMQENSILHLKLDNLPLEDLENQAMSGVAPPEVQHVSFPPPAVLSNKTHNTFVLLFLHIPKTGGTSLESVMRKASVQKHKGKQFCKLTVRTHGRRALAVPDNACRLVVGERDYSFFEFLDAYYTGDASIEVPVVPFTMLRHPVRRSVSQYEWFRKQGFINETVPLRFFMEHGNCNPAVDDLYCKQLHEPGKCEYHGFCGVIRNHQTDMLTGMTYYSGIKRSQIWASDEQASIVAKWNLQRLSFVLIHEYWNASVCLLLFALQWHSVFKENCDPSAPPERASLRNLRPAVQTQGKYNFTEKYSHDTELLQLIRDRVQYDVEIYQMALGMFRLQVEIMDREMGTGFLSSIPSVQEIRNL